MADPERRVRAVNPLPNPLLIGSPLVSGAVVSIGAVGVGIALILSGRPIGGSVLIAGGLCFALPTALMVLQRVKSRRAAN